ncbi:MAG: hypothetical protein M9931_12145 [Chitinophagales bacterium]|nr:hypothetical protein [Cyclobacteriaceae bacterium]MCO5281784.1 hypothetical protein [Chitinophagales bacterium]OJV27046.1 MAG: hypothetical protein BGO32_11325 [Bacteroidetes bacterium 37-13]HRN93878.1 hypothetical protein [Chitinophagales bacterium]HRP39599.1 hypothetical protein [Chitinophagales bacterium]
MKINPLEYELGFDRSEFNYSAKFRRYKKTNHNDEVFIWQNSDKSIKPYTDNELLFNNFDVRF